MKYWPLNQTPPLSRGDEPPFLLPPGVRKWRLVCPQGQFSLADSAAQVGRRPRKILGEVCPMHPAQAVRVWVVSLMGILQQQWAPTSLDLYWKRCRRGEIMTREDGPEGAMALK